MARVDTLTNFLTDVADAIRTKTGSQETIQASSFDTAISNIPSGGTTDWSAIGYSSAPEDIQVSYNYSVTTKNTYTSGKSFLNDKKLQYMPVVNTSAETSWSQKFMRSTVKIIPLLNTSNVTNMYAAFRECSSLYEVADIDTSKVTNMEKMFYGNASLKKIPNINTSRVETFFEFIYASSSAALVEIPELDMSSATNIKSMFGTYSSNFTYLTTLGGFKDLGKAFDTSANEYNQYYTLDLKATGINHDSLMNIINKLYDIKTKGCQNQKIILSQTAINRLSAAEIQIATDKGWIIATS